MWPTIARTLTTLDALLLLKATTMYVSLVRNLLGHYEVGTIADIGTFGQNGRGCVHSRSLDSYLDFLPSTFQHSAGTPLWRPCSMDVGFVKWQRYYESI